MSRVCSDHPRQFWSQQEKDEAQEARLQAEADAANADADAADAAEVVAETVAA